MILIQILITSFFVFAINYTLLPGEIFGFITRAWDRYKDRLITKADSSDTKKGLKIIRWWVILDKIEEPLLKCPVCMAPWYGTALYFIIPWERLDYSFRWHNPIDWVIIIICAMGLNSIIVRTFNEADD